MQNNISLLLNNHSFMNLLTSLQNKIMELERRIEDLEYKDLEHDFINGIPFRENAFSYDDFTE